MSLVVLASLACQHQPSVAAPLSCAQQTGTAAEACLLAELGPDPGRDAFLEVCPQLTDPRLKDACLFAMAQTEPDHAVCEGIEDDLLQNECHLQRLDRLGHELSPKAMLRACADDVPSYITACFHHALTAWTAPLLGDRAPFWFERDHLDDQVAAMVEVAHPAVSATVHSFSGLLFRLDDPARAEERCGALPDPDLCLAPFPSPSGEPLAEMVERWPSKAHGTRWW